MADQAAPAPPFYIHKRTDMPSPRTQWIRKGRT